MPVYLCQPGVTAEEPWRHGIQVYAAPFDLVDLPPPDAATTSTIHVGDTRSGVMTGATGTLTTSTAGGRDTSVGQQQQQQQQPAANASQIIDATGDGASTHYARAAQSGLEIRRIRHAEVVLVDDVCVAFGRHWLRLRWPGHKGGFAGYIALGKVDDKVMPKQISDALQGELVGGGD